ncbi:AHH domain-containing protein [Chitinimonas sp. BJB300]|uniref:AHH domain-containing protein n=2 Tax=Chitinimonas sp. BJB300 TaxID=1559339 RepID=UPI0013044C28|nr:AHH domain-containing protein [Chitinimonas sp. BJB300]
MSDYLISQGYKPGDAAYQSLMQAGSTMLGAMVGTLAGSTQAGAATALAGTTNNYLKHSEILALQSKLKECEQNQCDQTAKDKLVDDYAKRSAQHNAELAACKDDACLNEHRREIAEAAKASDALRQIDQLSDASQGMQRLNAMQKTDNALLATQNRISNLKQEARTLGQFAKNHCQGLSDAQCAGKLDTALKSNTQLGVALATMTPLVGEADSIKTVLTGTDLNGEEASRLLGVLGVLTGGAAQKVGKGIGAAIDAGKTVDKVGDAGKAVSGAKNAETAADSTKSAVKIAEVAPQPSAGKSNLATPPVTLSKEQADAFNRGAGPVSEAGGYSTERLLSGLPGQVTGGSSSKLGKNLNEAMGRNRSDSWTGYQAQHLLPSELKSHPILKKVGIDLDDASNGVFLPSSMARPEGVVSGIPRHTGSHPNYTEAVRQSLNNMDVSLPVEELQRQVFDLQGKLRSVTESGMPVRNVDGAKTDVWLKWLNK